MLYCYLHVRILNHKIDILSCLILRTTRGNLQLLAGQLAAGVIDRVSLPGKYQQFDSEGGGGGAGTFWK